jgi:hypothetical protein
MDSLDRIEEKTNKTSHRRENRTRNNKNKKKLHTYLRGLAGLCSASKTL